MMLATHCVLMIWYGNAHCCAASSSGIGVRWAAFAIGVSLLLAMVLPFRLMHILRRGRPNRSFDIPRRLAYRR
jgi:hypothetical protein